ncbi:MAG: hypothetical protein WBB07_01380 [Mycobacterium sp.]
MPALVVFPDADVIAHKMLAQGLVEHGVTGIDIATQLPSPMPDRFIRCFTLPGREMSRRTQWCQVITQVYDSDDEVRCADFGAPLWCDPASRAGHRN